MVWVQSIPDSRVNLRVEGSDPSLPLSPSSVYSFFEKQGEIKETEETRREIITN